MTSTIINQIGKKVQVAVISAVLAGGLLLASPMTAGATDTVSCPWDYDGNGAVGLFDVLEAAQRLNANDDSVRTSIFDVLEVVQHLGKSCS